MHGQQHSGSSDIRVVLSRDHLRESAENTRAQHAEPVTQDAAVHPLHLPILIPSFPKLCGQIIGSARTSNTTIVVQDFLYVAILACYLS